MSRSRGTLRGFPARIRLNETLRRVKKCASAMRAAMVEKRIMSSPNVVDIARYRRRADGSRSLAISPRLCRHCGAALMEGDHEDECSSALNVDVARLRWQAAQILRGIV